MLSQNQCSLLRPMDDAQVQKISSQNLYRFRTTSFLNFLGPNSNVNPFNTIFNFQSIQYFSISQFLSSWSQRKPTRNWPSAIEVQTRCWYNNSKKTNILLYKTICIDWNSQGWSQYYVSNTEMSIKKRIQTILIGKGNY